MHAINHYTHLKRAAHQWTTFTRAADVDDGRLHVNGATIPAERACAVSFRRHQPVRGRL